MTLNVAKFDFSKFGQKCPKNFSMQFFVISRVLALKFRYFEKATEFCEISTLDLIVCIKRQIQSGDFAKFCGLLTKPQLYYVKFLSNSDDLMKNLFSKAMAIHGFSSTKKNTELQVKFRYSEKAIKIWLSFHFFHLLLLKGQELTKQNCQAVNSSKKQTFFVCVSKNK